MDALTAITFFKDNALPIVAVIITLIFVYHYLIEKEDGLRLSRKYRKNIVETQSKIFLNATQYLISGNKDLAIKEFLNAVDLNRETIDTYFALGNLFRSNGEIEKAISIHRSLIARENITESTRLQALKELAVDFDKGGFLDKAVETYKDVLKINRDQHEVIQSLCRIYEDTEDWDMAFQYRTMLSKVGQENQSETISHILIEKAKHRFNEGDYKACLDQVEDAFRFAPSVSAKILKIKLDLVFGKLDSSKSLLLELLNENPMYTAFIFESLNDVPSLNDEDSQLYKERFEYLKDYFLSLTDNDLMSSPSVVLSQVRLLKNKGMKLDAQKALENWLEKNPEQAEILKVEYINLLIENQDSDEALAQTKTFLLGLNKTLTKHFCSQCGYNSDDVFWRCPQCHEWETIQFRWKV